MPCSMAFFISGESLPESKVLPAPMPILAKRAMSSFSDGSRRAELQTKFRMLKNFERGLLLPRASAA